MFEIVLSTGYLFFFLFVIGKSKFFRHENITGRHFQVLFIIKVLAAIALTVIYTQFYPVRHEADIFKYYDDSKVIYDAVFTHTYDFFRMLSGYQSGNADLMIYYNEMHYWFTSDMIFNDARTMIRLNVLFRFLSAGTYFPHALFMCFLGFMGLTGLFKFFTTEIKGRNILLLAGIFLLPSVLLWTSGLIKETLLLFAIGMSMYYINKLCSNKGSALKNILLVLFFLFLLLNSKLYVFVVLIPLIIAYVVSKIKGARPFYIYPPVLLLYFVMVFKLFPVVSNGYTVQKMLQEKQKEFYRLATSENAGSLISIPPVTDRFMSLVKNSPNAFLLTLLRPHLLESKNSMMWIAAIENMVLLLLLLITIYFHFGKRRPSEISYPVFHFAFWLVIIMFCLIGLVTPILGAVVRYKVAALPFLVVLIFYHPQWIKAENILAKRLLKSS